MTLGVLRGVERKPCRSFYPPQNHKATSEPSKQPSKSHKAPSEPLLGPPLRTTSSEPQGPPSEPQGTTHPNPRPPSEPQGPLEPPGRPKPSEPKGPNPMPKDAPPRTPRTPPQNHKATTVKTTRASIRTLAPPEGDPQNPKTPTDPVIHTQGPSSGTSGPQTPMFPPQNSLGSPKKGGHSKPQFTTPRTWQEDGTRIAKGQHDDAVGEIGDADEFRDRHLANQLFLRLVAEVTDRAAITSAE